MSAGCVDDVAPRRAREVRVVEHHPSRAGRERRVELVGERPERASALVAVQPDVAARDVLRRDPALARAGNAHHQDDVRVGPDPRGHRAVWATVPERVREERPVLVAQRERRGTGGRPRGLRAPGPRNRDDAGRETEEPGERDLFRVHVEPVCDRDELRAARQPGRAARAAERRVRDHHDPGLATPLDDASADRPVVEQAQRDLDRGDRCELERLVELSAVDVRHPDAADELLVDEPRQGSDRRPPRRPRIGRVGQVEVDREAVERREARLAVGADGLCPSVGHPCAADPPHAALRHDPRFCPGAAAAEPAGEQPLVVAELPFAVAVRPCGVEDRDAGLGGGGDRVERTLLVAVRVRREAHAAEADAELRGAKPSGRVQDAEAMQIAVALRLPRPSDPGDAVGTLRVLWRAWASTCFSSFRR